MGKQVWWHAPVIPACTCDPSIPLMRYGDKNQVEKVKRQLAWGIQYSNKGPCFHMV